MIANENFVIEFIKKNRFMLVIHTILFIVVVKSILSNEAVFSGVFLGYALGFGTHYLISDWLVSRNNQSEIYDA